MTLLRTAMVLCCLVILTVAAAAQRAGSPVGELGVRTDGHTLAPGIAVAETTRLTSAGSYRSESLSVDMTGGRASIEARVAPRGIWTGESIDAIVGAAGGLSGMAVVVEPTHTESPFVPGIVMADGVVWAWPARGPLLVGSAEGTVRLVDAPESRRASVALDGGTSLTLSSINGPPEGHAVLVIGLFDGRTRAASLWPEGSQLLTLRAANVSARTLDDEWIVAHESPLRAARLDAGQWGLLVPPDVFASARASLAIGSRLRFDVPMPPELSLARWVVPAGEWLEPSSPPDEPSRARPLERWRALLATDSGGGRVWMLESGGVQRGVAPWDWTRLAALLHEEGATRLTLLAADDHPRLLRELPSGGIRRPGGYPTARVALVAMPERATLADPNAPGGALVPVVMARTLGSSDRDGINGSWTLVDGRTGESARLDHFWMARMPDGVRRAGEASTPQWAELYFSEPARVRAVDLVHAQNAGFSPSFNLRGYRLMGRESATRPWRTLHEVRHDSPVARERVRLDNAGMIDALRLEVIDPAFQPGLTTARLVEIIVWGEAPARPR